MVDSTFDESHLKWLKHAHVPLCMGLSFGVQKKMSHQWATKSRRKAKSLPCSGARKLPNFGGKQKNGKSLELENQRLVTRPLIAFFFGDTCSSIAVLQTLKADAARPARHIID